MRLESSVCTVLCSRPAFAHGSANFIAHIGPVQLLSHVFVHSTLARPTGQEGVVAEVKETEACGGGHNAL